MDRGEKKIPKCAGLLCVYLQLSSKVSAHKWTPRRASPRANWFVRQLKLTLIAFFWTLDRYFCAINYPHQLWQNVLLSLPVQLHVSEALRLEGAGGSRGSWSASPLCGCFTLPKRSFSADRWCLSALPIWALWLASALAASVHVGFHTAMTVKEHRCSSPLKRAGEAARTSSQRCQVLFSRPELIARVLSSTQDGAL